MEARPQEHASGRISEAIAGVEAQLGSFWSAPETKDGASVAKVRAATMNFALVGTGDPAPLRASLEAISEVHAGRGFLLTVDPHIAPWGMETNVDAVCRIGGDVPICYDRIEIGFGALAATRAASVVGALALSEVPVVIELAAGAPSTLVDTLAGGADRIIVDSAHTKLGRLAELAGKVRAPIGDRLFVRMFSWRDLVARFFDGRPGWTKAIRRVAIGIDAGAEPADSFPAPALLIGWLASRLGWRFESRGVARRRSDRDADTIAIDVRPDKREGLARGDLVSVQIVVDDGGAIELSCARITPGAVRWSIGPGRPGVEAVEHEHRLGFRDETWVALKAIDSTEGDAVYRAALIAAAKWSSL